LFYETTREELMNFDYRYTKNKLMWIGGFAKAATVITGFAAAYYLKNDALIPLTISLLLLTLASLVVFIEPKTKPVEDKPEEKIGFFDLPIEFFEDRINNQEGGPDTDGRNTTT